MRTVRAATEEMFTAGVERCNGVVVSQKVRQRRPDVINGLQRGDGKVKAADGGPGVYSIIGLSEDNKLGLIPTVEKPRVRNHFVGDTHHETLQRIEIQDDCNYYQQHWFSAGLERMKLEDRSREERLEITRHELKKQLKQIIKCRVGKSRKKSAHTRKISETKQKQPPSSLSPSLSVYDRLLAPCTCEIENCEQPALPCTKQCTLHIMHNSDQVLFDYCTAKFADNTQCSVPVFDITHELPLCPEHARKRDNYQMYQEAKPKKLRKKQKTSAMIRPQKRSKRKKRNSIKIEDCVVDTPVIISEEIVEQEPELAEDMVEQVLSMQEPDGLELVTVEQALVTQASHLLEESDINTVLSTIQADEFNDLFTVNHNGEYEPSREEAEELERALAAVDNDVKSLEKLSQTHGLLDTFLDEQNLVESLVQIPDMFHNGYVVPCGSDSMVAHSSSRLLPVEPHSHS